MLGNVTDLALIWDYYPLWEERPTSPGFYLSEWKGREGSPLSSIILSSSAVILSIYGARGDEDRPRVASSPPPFVPIEVVPQSEQTQNERNAEWTEGGGGRDARVRMPTAASASRINEPNSKAFLLLR